MTSNDIFSQISARQGPGFGAGLCAFSQLLARLNNPQNSFQIIHVAGTNGKGSVCTLLAHALTCAGNRTGLFVSPHLVSPTERITVNGNEISPNDFALCVRRVLAVEQEPLNFFEILTAAAFIYFAETKCKYAVLETGLGGRKDPTNVCLPRASVITSVGLDHIQILGDSVEKIAAEKAGICKPGVPLFCGPVSPQAREIIKQAAAAQKSPVYFVREGEPFSPAGVDVSCGNFLIKKEKNVYPLHLMGQFQTVNACLVWQVLRFLQVSEDAILTAFVTVQLPGRFEVIKKGEKTFILDGAHNPQAVAALVNFWQQTPYAKNAALVCGFMKDKDYQKMLELLVPHFQQIIVTQPPSARAAGRAELSRFLTRTGITFEPDLQAALCLAGELSHTVLCTGSFYLVGAARQQLLR